MLLQVSKRLDKCTWRGHSSLSYCFTVFIIQERKIEGRASPAYLSAQRVDKILRQVDWRSPGQRGENHKRRWSRLWRDKLHGRIVSGGTEHTGGDGAGQALHVFTARLLFLSVPTLAWKVNAAV